MKRIPIFFVSLILVFILFDSCKHEPIYPLVNPKDTTKPPPAPGGGDSNCDQSVIYFQNDVLPIFVSNCAKSGCHDPATAEKGVILNSYSSIMNSDVVDPGDAAGSDIVEVITESDPDKHMPPPPNTPLTVSQINLISNWINQGAQNTICNAAVCDTSNVTYSGSIRPIIQNKCQGCHSGSSPSGGFDFTTHGGLAGASSRLYGAVSHASGFVAMPQGGNKLPNCDIRKIKIWIDAGMPNN